MKIEDLKAERLHRQIAWLVLFSGLAATGVGLIGVWMQGMFWDISTNYLTMADQVLHSEVVESFCLPAIVTSIGGLAMSWVILASSLTRKYSLKQRSIVFVVFAIVYVIAIFIPAKIAGDKMWIKAIRTEEKSQHVPAGTTGK